METNKRCHWLVKSNFQDFQHSQDFYNEKNVCACACVCVRTHTYEHVSAHTYHILRKNPGSPRLLSSGLLSVPASHSLTSTASHRPGGKRTETGHARPLFQMLLVGTHPARCPLSFPKHHEFGKSRLPTLFTFAAVSMTDFFFLFERREDLLKNKNLIILKD